MEMLPTWEGENMFDRGMTLDIHIHTVFHSLLWDQ